LKRFNILMMALMCAASFAAVSHAAKPAPQSILGGVQEYIESNMPWPPGSARVDFLSDNTEFLPLPANITIRIEPAGKPDFIGDMVFLVKSYKGGSLVKTEPVKARIEVLQDVVVAARSLPAGTILKTGDLSMTSKWVRRIHPQSLTSPEEASGKRLTVHASPGAELLATMLRETLLVRKGKMVKMVFDNGSMQIVTVGLSEEDGSAGNIIRIRNVTSNKIVYARVLSDSLVRIEF
jgi:flagella basal body P-ring formation protein FlgA